MLLCLPGDCRVVPGGLDAVPVVAAVAAAQVVVGMVVILLTHAGLVAQE